MKNIFFALTYYHIMFTIMYSKNLEGSNEIYLIKDYLKFDDDFVKRLKELNIFDNVVLISEDAIRNKIVEEYQNDSFKNLTTEQISHKFDEIILPFYSYLNCDNTNFYIFNTKTYIYYYAYKNNASIIYIEDGYKSVFKNKNTFLYRGKTTFLNEYINNGYINLSLDDSHIKKIIGAPLESKEDANIKDKYINIDSMKLYQENYDEYYKIFSYLFDFKMPDFKKNSCLLLTQPLSRYRYCSVFQQYLLYKKIINNALKTYDYVYIKLHPADVNIYHFKKHKNVIVLKGNYPVELLSGNTNAFKEIITFDSTSLDFFGNDIKKKSILDIKERNFKNVKIFIENYVKDESINVNELLKIVFSKDLAKIILSRVKKKK